MADSLKRRRDIMKKFAHEVEKKEALMIRGRKEKGVKDSRPLTTRRRQHAPLLQGWRLTLSAVSWS